jgi:protein arginine phosphatase
MVKRNLRVLFICKHNALRSRIAEAHLKKINKNIDVKSAGIISGGKTSKDEDRVLKNNGFVFKKKFNVVSRPVIMWADIIIIVANDIPKKIFQWKPEKKDIRVWKVKDSFTGASDKLVEKIITDITCKVNRAFGQLL